MKNIYNLCIYNVHYWKNGSNDKASLSCHFDFEILRDLEPWTTYCVQAQVFIPDWNKTGEWSEPVCKQTKEDETAPSWVIVLVVLAASVCVALLLLGCFALSWYIYKKTKYTFSPGSALPQHLKEFLGHPHHSPLLFFSPPLSDESEVFDKLSVIAELSESGVQDTPPELGSPELAPEEETCCATQSSPHLTSASEGNQTHIRIRN